MIDSLIKIFNLVLYQPLLNILFLFYYYLPGYNLGIAIIFLTILVRVILYPLSAKAIHSQKALQELQPKILEIQKRHKDSKEQQALAIMNLYKSTKISPFSGFSTLLVQFPILVALYRAFTKGLDSAELVNLYSFVPKPEQINTIFFLGIDLSQPFLAFAILAGVLQLIQLRMTIKKTKSEDKMSQFAQLLQKQTIYFFPFLTIIILVRLPSAIALYWLTTTIFSIFQQYFVIKKYDQKRESKPN